MVIWVLRSRDSVSPDSKRMCHTKIHMRAVITVLGKDRVGLLAGITTTCADANVNVLELNQSILQEFFAMVMLVDISKMNCEIDILKENLMKNVAGMAVHVMHEDIFNSMHRI